MEVSPGLEQKNITTLVLITLAAIIILAVSFYASYSYSRLTPGGIVLPGGVSYLGNSPTPVSR